MATQATDTFLRAKVMNILNVYSKLIIIEMQTILKAKRKVASGTLVNSFKAEVIEKNGEVELKIASAPYAIFLDKGKRANTKPPPIKPLLQWIKVKGLSKGLKRDMSFAFAMSKSIGKKAIAPLNFYSIALNKWVPKMRGEIQKTITQELQQKVLLDFKALNSKITIK